MKRIYVTKVEIGIHPLTSENLNYLTKSLRFKGGESLLVFDGEYEACAVFERKSIKILNLLKKKEETSLKLAIAEIQRERLEWAVEKSTELGVTNIVLLNTRYTQKTYKIDRLKKISISACRQCGRIGLPLIEQNSFEDFIVKAVPSEWIFASLNSNNSKINRSIVGAIIGPEGGWSNEEEIILQHRFDSLWLNNNVLRTETAAITSLNYILHKNSALAVLTD